ncbi:META domain-containing protein [Marinobacter sediminum]|uniref:META domain-containing protein n=1 Tax=Marinobacter sediminum TaxID=256323 RepID=UPI00202F7577|nr:META domain-containing protein [Marinobacter sediminum]MCM0613472.1 META domain-containing protein [Marinobacter sediminum]
MYSRRVSSLSVVAAAGLLFSGCATVNEPKEPIGGHYTCGQLDIEVSANDDSRLLGVDYLDKRLLLKPSESASGALYVAPGDDSTRFWSKGERATLTVRGQTYPECLSPGAIEMPFEARGNEPFWHAVVEADQLALTRPYEQNKTLTLPVELQTANRHGRKFLAETDGMRVTLTVARQLCQDTMSGAQFPNQAQLTVNGEVFQGCGGDPERLLRGAEWVVEDLAGGGIIDSSRITIAFLEGSRVAGRGSCNHYAGRYQLSGEGGLTFSQVATTRMACAPSLMAQEDRFLNLMNQISRGRIGPHRELVLSTPEGVSMTAFQSDHESP